MFAKEAVPANIHEYAATSMRLETRDEIYSAMVVYGLLTYKDGFVSIPNRELMDSFASAMKRIFPGKWDNCSYRRNTEEGRKSFDYKLCGEYSD